MSDIKIAMLGLDTIHTIEFAKRLHAPDCPPAMKVEGMKVSAVFAEPTRYQDAAGIGKRSEQLKSWGIPVTDNADEAVKGADVIFLELNDPGMHLDWVKKAAKYGKPIFLDKPVAWTLEDTHAIFEVVRKNKLNFFSSSSLRFNGRMLDAVKKIKSVDYGVFHAPLGMNPQGESALIWYAVHGFEAVQKVMGLGAISLTALKHAKGFTLVINYPSDRYAVLDLAEACYSYGGSFRDKEGNASNYLSSVKENYKDIMLVMKDYYSGKIPLPATEEESTEVMALCVTAEKASRSGREEKISR